jgi:group I intron endonuclease
MKESSDEPDTYSIYIHIFPNSKKYVGITKQDPKQRWANGAGYKTQPLMHRAIEKYGWENIRHVVLLRGLSKDDAERAEVFLIDALGTSDLSAGYNYAFGANLNGPITEQTREKLRAANMGKRIPPEVRQKISDSTKGENAFWYGRQHTEETKQKISQNRRGKCVGCSFSEHRCQKISEKMQGNQNAPQKETVCIETGQTYRSAREAARQTGLRPASISECCRRIRKSTGGLHWAYVER